MANFIVMNKVVAGKTEYITICIYGVACVLPVFSDNYIPGFTALLFGWLGMLGEWQVFFAWLANVFFLAAFLKPQHEFSGRLIYSFASLLLASSFLMIKHIFIWSDEDHFYRPGIGCWFWFGSLFYLFFSILLQKKAVRKLAAL